MTDSTGPRKLFDISLPLSVSLAPWPGDIPFSRTVSDRIAEGSSVNLSSITMSVHSGTHADAPAHYLDNGETIDLVDAGVYIGPAIVVDVRNRRSITVADLAAVNFGGAQRVLLKTCAWSDHSFFPETVPTMEEAVPDFLARLGVILVGVDLPSVDALDSKTLPIHHALGSAGIHILECLNLANVPAGRYELIALPLKIEGSDGAPVRAVLIET